MGGWEKKKKEKRELTDRCGKNCPQTIRGGGVRNDLYGSRIKLEKKEIKYEGQEGLRKTSRGKTAKGRKGGVLEKKRCTLKKQAT